jgi:Flp pilus assembly protein TadG
MKRLPHLCHPRSARARRGALLSLELVLVLPIVMALFLALIEFSLLWSANQRVKEASSAGCRVATYNGSNLPAVQQAVEFALHKQALVTTYKVQVEGGLHSGDPIAVTVQVPMRAASPDLLSIFGFRLMGRHLQAQTVMRRE